MIPTHNTLPASKIALHFPETNRLKVISCAALLTVFMGAGHAASPTSKHVSSNISHPQLLQMMERLTLLERQNQALAEQVKRLESAAKPNHSSTTGLETNARLATIEQEQLSMSEQLGQLAQQTADEETLSANEETISFEGALVSVAQSVGRSGRDTANDSAKSALNYRGDLLASWTLKSDSTVTHGLTGHLRFGQGNGVSTVSTHTGTINSTGFEVAGGSEETYAVVAQAYYNIDWALDGDRFNEQSGDTLSLTVGKMDLFGFFDQNDVAGDEAAA